MAASALDEVIIVGASFNGLCAAWQLVRRGVQRITIVEQHRVGHVHGASHGRARLISAVGYEDPVLSLFEVSRTDAWPALAEQLGETLTRAVPAVVFGELGAAFRRRAQAAYRLGELVRPVDTDDARRRFPHLNIKEGMGVLRDQTGTLVATELAYDVLLAWLQGRGVRVSPNTKVLSVHSTADGLWLETDRGPRVAERVIVTAGGWSPALIARLDERMTWRQEVSAFFALDTPESDWRIGRFSPFRVLAEDEGITWSGMPEFADRGVKISCHLGGPVDESPREAVARAQVWFEEAFSLKVAKVLGIEVRKVSQVSDRAFLVDSHFDDPRIVFAAGFNGHEAAFAPAVGRVLAELCLDGRSSMPEFQSQRRAFGIPRRGLAEARKKKRRSGPVI